MDCIYGLNIFILFHPAAPDMLVIVSGRGADQHGKNHKHDKGGQLVGHGWTESVGEFVRYLFKSFSSIFILSVIIFTYCVSVAYNIK